MGLSCLYKDCSNEALQFSNYCELHIDMVVQTLPKRFGLDGFGDSLPMRKPRKRAASKAAQPTLRKKIRPKAPTTKKRPKRSTGKRAGSKKRPNGKRLAPSRK